MGGYGAPLQICSIFSQNRKEGRELFLSLLLSCLQLKRIIMPKCCILGRCILLPFSGNKGAVFVRVQAKLLQQRIQWLPEQLSSLCYHVICFQPALCYPQCGENHLATWFPSVFSLHQSLDLCHHLHSQS